MPIWQLSILPSVPEYCRWTPADFRPFLANPVGSAISVPRGSQKCSFAYSRLISRSLPSSHGVRFRNRCSAFGSRSPEYSEIVHPFFFSSGAEQAAKVMLRVPPGVRAVKQRLYPCDETFEFPVPGFKVFRGNRAIRQFGCNVKFAHIQIISQTIQTHRRHAGI